MYVAKLCINCLQHSANIQNVILIINLIVIITKLRGRKNYTGKLEDGTVFDSFNGRDPLQFTLGKGQVISGFEQAVIGMNPGEPKTTTVPEDKAYGLHCKIGTVYRSKPFSGTYRTVSRSPVTNHSR
ncbi:MAG: peptidylprolyl isomerase [Candidatus Scalinduaceae bacterium]